MRRTLRLTLYITYEVTSDDDIQTLRDNLLEIPGRLMPRPWLTEDTDATVVVIQPSVEEF